MAKYDVFPNPSGEGYILDVQADLLDVLNTRVVVPLLPLSLAPKPAKRLNPVFEVEGTSLVMATQFIAAVPTSVLKTSFFNLADQFEDITNATDMLLQGF